MALTDSRILSPPPGGEETVLSVEGATRLRDELTVALGPDTGHQARVAAPESAFAALVARVHPTGGHATPEEQDVLRQAEQALAGGAEKPCRTPQERAEAVPASDAATGQTEQASVRSVCDYECHGATPEDVGP
jgi:hypothetical protein